MFIIVLILKYFGYFIANTLQHFNLCKLRAKRNYWDNVTNCPTRKSQRHFAAGYAIFGTLLPQKDLPPVDDVDAWGQVVTTFVDGLAQKIVDGRSACFVGRYFTDGCIVGAQGLEFVEGAESLVVIVVPKASIEPRLDDDGAGVP